MIRERAILKRLALWCQLLPACAYANGVSEIPEHKAPPPLPDAPCCWVDNQLKYEEALQGAWLCTLAQGEAGQRSPLSMDSGDHVAPDRTCWNASFDSACAGVIYHTYRPIPAVLGPHLMLQRSANYIPYLKKKRESCHKARSDHPLLQYCQNYCKAPENYGHSGPPTTPPDTPSSQPSRPRPVD